MVTPAPLMSLNITSKGTTKHVVPWQNREEFIQVHEDIYSEDSSRQLAGLDRILTWKARIGPKLSVAIESSAALCQALHDYSKAKLGGLMEDRERGLRSQLGLAIIRFVNHVTEKAQNKAVAQPIHVIAKDFGIPEWIVRLRHEATHGALPSLDLLVRAVRWAFQYLNTAFWQHQMKEDNKNDDEDDVKKHKLKSSQIRGAMYDFQKARYRELNDEVADADNPDRTGLKLLTSYLSQDRLRFIKVFLEDGIFVSTEEQLEVFGVLVDDLLEVSPPIVPTEVAKFWAPLLRRIYMSGALPLLTSTALFFVTPEKSLRNYQLVAWLRYMLAQSADPEAKFKGKRMRQRREDGHLFCNPLQIPKQTLLAGCIENVGPYTVHLLKYLLDRESLGDAVYDKLATLFKINPAGETRDDGLTIASPENKEDSEEEDIKEDELDTFYTVEDVKKEREKAKTESETQVQDVESALRGFTPWSLCTDIVDWSKIPIGHIPKPTDHENEEDEDEEEEDEEVEEAVEEAEEIVQTASSEEEDKEEAEKSQEETTPGKRKRRRKSSDKSPSPKRPVYTPKEEVL